MPVTVRLAGGRLLPVDVRGILGNVTLAGANTTDEMCGGAGTSKIADCAQTMRAFSRATVHAASPRPGVVTLRVSRTFDLRPPIARSSRQTSGAGRSVRR